jgi:HPt (histidine-containing phosphotransfer) domain-containing protein
MAARIITEEIVPELAPLIPRFLANCGKEADQIESALQEEDWETVSRLAHSIKGAGGWYGFSGMAGIGLELQRAATAGNFEMVSRRLVELRDYLNRVQVRFSSQAED